MECPDWKAIVPTINHFNTLFVAGDYEDSSEEKKPEKPQKKDSDEGMDDLLGKLDEL